MIELSKVEYYILDIDGKLYMRDLWFWYERIGSDWMRVRDEKEGELEMEFMARRTMEKYIK